MITTLLERICTACGHRIAPLCRSIVRNDRWWQQSHSACEHHCKMRKHAQSAMLDLPFAPGPELAAQQVLARDPRPDATREPRKA